MIYYVDSSFTAQGDGSSPENPLRSHDAIQPKPGDSVLFRRGTSYRSGIYPPDGEPGAPISFGAYGEGDEPRFYGSVNASDPRDWVAEGACVWRYAGTLASEACNIVFDYGESFGVMAWTRDGLNSTGKWFFSAPFSTDHTPADAALLHYSESNPAECHRDIEICVFGKRRMATGGRHLRFSDLHFLCSGVHGFAGTDVEDVRIERCKFSFIGGCPWSVEGHIRFGNGVEFWDGARNCVVTGCEFREIYDSCATTQGPGENCRQFEEIHIDGNRCENYGMAAFELRDRIGRNVTFNGNSCEGAGAGFSMQDETPPRASEIYPEPMGHHIFAWRIEHAWPDGRIEILRNTFAGVPTGAVFYRRISDAALPQIKTDIEA